LEFRTELHLSDKQLTIGYEDQILLIGSCFSDSIGKILSIKQFQTMVNPFGTVFNPLIICKLLINAIDKVKYTPEGLAELNGLFFHHDLHSKFSHSKQEKILSKANKKLEKTSIFLKTADYLVLTFGSSIGYYLKSSGEVVGNCHKISSDQFDKRFITDKELKEAFKSLLDKLAIINPGLKIILTVSPIRHTREGLTENSRSKARLIELSHYLASSYDAIDYFPSFEIMIDDLRDYRYYESDLIHPNQTAVQYIFDKFKSAYFFDHTLDQLKKIEKLQSAINHKSLHVNSQQHQDFLKKLLIDIDSVEQSFGRAIFRKAKKKINKQIL